MTNRVWEKSSGTFSARFAVLVVATMSGILSIPDLCSAQVQLPIVNLGLANFEDGYSSPGWFLQEFPDYYKANELKDPYGITVSGVNELTAFSTTTHVAY